jgi:hypothetical protein
MKRMNIAAVDGRTGRRCGVRAAGRRWDPRVAVEPVAARVRVVAVLRGVGLRDGDFRGDEERGFVGVDPAIRQR